MSKAYTVVRWYMWSVMAFVVLLICLAAWASTQTGPPQKVVTVYHRVNYSTWRLNQEALALANCNSIAQAYDNPMEYYTSCVSTVRTEFKK